jgi:hypothetical protein
LAVFDDPLAESPEKERYDENYQKQIAGYEWWTYCGIKEFQN